MSVSIVLHQNLPFVVVAERHEFGLPTRTLVGLPRRVFTVAERTTALPLFLPYVDARRTVAQRNPAEIAVERAGTSWLASTRKAQMSLLAWVLLVEDPQRRLEVLDVAPLMHQRSLVEHVLNAPDLKRVLIADEVGLGKTVEAGLILQRLLQSRENARALYLAPARLVRNVVAEFSRLGLDARRWTSIDSDARLDRDTLVVASLQKAVRDSNADALLAAGPWDIVVADECHHLSDWAEGGGSPNAGYRLLERLIASQRPDVGRLLLLSGTPHQGHQARFENLLSLLRSAEESQHDTAGRVIFRTKEMVTDWHGQPLFPLREVLPPKVVHLSEQWARWYEEVAALYDGARHSQAGRRAGGWAKGQALQWAASSVSAGLGFLVRLAIRRLRWGIEDSDLVMALGALRPYRGGSATEPLDKLYERLLRQMNILDEAEDSEEVVDGDERGWVPDEALLGQLLRDGVRLKGERADADKWDAMTALLEEAGSEKVVLFCQPVETVEVVADEIHRAFGVRPAIIIGGQTDSERDAEVAAFRSQRGPQFLVSSRAGGEGINLQVARRLIHLDVPWNPMDLEQRVGRIHRFGSRETILVNTIVVSGTREADAYRIAREKLRRIVANLAPGEFEALFSRVMSLVPPEELSGALSTDAPWLPDGDVDRRIADIVGAGYARWSEFTKMFADNEARIRAVDPGLADWNDLRTFLERSSGAQRGQGATRPVFAISGSGVETTTAKVETLNVYGGVYVCDETDGLPAEDSTGQPLMRLGTAHADVVEAVRARICEPPDDRIGSVRLPRSGQPGWPNVGSSIIMAYASQKLALLGGSAEEREARIEIFTLQEDGVPRQIPRATVAELIRQICLADRQTIPDSSLLTEHLIMVNRKIIDMIQKIESPNEEGVTIIAVWPIVCFAVSVL